MPRRILITTINVLVAAAHLVTGPDYRGPARALITGYAMDFLIPFAAYFLLCAAEPQFAWLRPWWLKVVIVWTVVSTAEFAQAFGYPLFGNTFDVLDFVAYAAGASTAAALDRWLLSRWSWWSASLRHLDTSSDSPGHRHGH